MTSIIALDRHDDLASIRHRLSATSDRRVVLVLPWDAGFFSRELDYDLLRREAERRQKEIALVSADPDRRAAARSAGFPAFPTVQEAEEEVPRWSTPAADQITPPPRPWWRAPVELTPPPERPRPKWLRWTSLSVRLLIFIAVLSVLAFTAYAIVPQGSVTLVPAGDEFSAIVPVAIDMEAEAVDTAAGVIPARRVGLEVEGYAEVETTGAMDVFAGQAVGTVVFRNLLAQDYRVPSGTVVRTSSTSYPVRFRTTQDVVVPAGGEASASIEAVDDRGGNVGAFQINQVEGVAASAVRVINPQSTTGAEAQEVRVATQSDLDRLEEKLMAELLDQAYREMHEVEGLLGVNETVLRPSLRVEAVPKRAFNRFVTEQADTVGLNMRILVSGRAADIDNARTVAYAVLQRQMPSSYRLLTADFEVGEVAEEDVTSGDFTIFVTAHGYGVASVDPGRAASLARGRRVDEARDELQAELPLAEPPEISLWPNWPAYLGWLERMPLLSLRINVRVLEQGQIGERFN